MDKLTTILQKHVAHGDDTTDKLLGASFVVVNAQGIIYDGSAGRIDFDVDSKPFQTDSFCWMASVTKIITITCVLQIVERDLIKLEDDVRPLIPELAAMQILRGFDSEDRPILEDNTKPITLHMLLTHTLGLGIDRADPDLMKWSKSVGRTANYMDFSRDGINTPLKFAPGEGWYYGTAVDWAGIVLEEVTGKSLGQYMQENILGPLGMDDTGFYPKKLPQTADRTVGWGYREGEELKPGPPTTPKEYNIELGGAGLFSTAKDYAKFFQAFLQGKLLKEETVQQMFTPQLNEMQRGILEFICYKSGIQDAFAPEFPTGLRLNHGIGGVLNVEDAPGKRRKGSMMWSGACNSRWWIDRETGIAAALVVHVWPHGDVAVKNVYNELELAVYEALGSS
ncbi:beta-lactamase/transpeptidase-like protein [Mariannaea sp. PMI_226]|nr:beta-lactamase/transpeptidase-like protein [Mariannaea sp. PMI_226]